MDKQFYLTEMTFLSNLINVPVEVQKKKTTDYWPLLKHLSDDEFHVSVVGIVREFVPTASVQFPMVSQFLKFCSSDAQGSAVKAISMLKAYIRKVGKYESVNFNNMTLHAVVERYGGWPAICAWTDSDWNINENRLIESYKLSYQSGFVESEIKHLPGISEKDAGFFRIYQIDNKTMQIIGSDKYQDCTLISSTYRDVKLIENKV
ncbi:MAG: DUF6475 domain-containing protein [Lutibacter sp.]|jgi:hypothetical protein